MIEEPILKSPPLSEGVISLKPFLDSGNQKFFQKDYQGALVEFEKVLEVNPRFYPVFFKMGMAKYFLGDHAGAELEWERAFKKEGEK